MYEKILVPVDGSATSDAGLAEAIKLARLTGGRIRLLHVLDELPFVMQAEGYGGLSSDVHASFLRRAEEMLAKARDRVSQAGVTVDTVLVESLRARLLDKVLEQVKDWGAEVIVLGTHGRRGVGRVLMGSDAENVARGATVPVLLVR